MKKWYKEVYFDKISWFLHNCDKFNLSNNEILLILFILFYNKNNVSISYELLTNKMNLSNKEIDKLISLLVNKHYLKIKTNSRGIFFDLDGLFEFDPTKYEISNNQNIYDILGDLFGKPLTPNELQKVNDLLNEYSEKQLLQASRVAEANNKLNLSYIEGILRNEKK